MIWKIFREVTERRLIKRRRLVKSINHYRYFTMRGVFSKLIKFHNRKLTEKLNLKELTGK